MSPEETVESTKPLNIDKKPNKPKLPKLKDFKSSNSDDGTLRIPFKLPILKLIVFENKRDYRRKVCMYTCNGFCQVLIGAVNMAVIIFAIFNEDTHAVLCCIGQHFFIAEGILVRNGANGWSIAFKARHSRLVHVMFQIIGILLSLCGTVYIVVSTGLSVSVHGIAGTVSMILSLITMFLGVGVISYLRSWIEAHRWMGAIAFLSSSIGLISGLTGKFLDWAGYTITGIVIASVIFYSIVIIFFPINKSITNMNRKRRLRKSLNASNGLVFGH